MKQLVRAPPRLSAYVLAFAALCAVSVNSHAQQSSPESDLAAGIIRVQTGDFYRALLTFKDVIDRSTTTGDTATVAQAHAYRAVAFVGLDQQERAREAVLLALAADPGIAIDLDTFGPTVVALFASARRPGRETPEDRGQAAEYAGRFQDAFLAYLAAYQALPGVPAPADDRRLRERIISVVLKLDARPAIPPEARAHLEKADDLLNADILLGGASAGPAAQQAAATELHQAVRIAPWWPEALMKLATAQQKLGRLDEALLNLNLYRLADPDGYLALTRPAPATATAGPAVLFVYWLPTSRALGHKPKTLCDGNHVADLANGHFVKLNVPPGYHTIKVSNKDMSIPFEADRAHYIRLNIEGYPAHLAMRLKTPDEGAEEIRRRGIVLNDPKHTFSTECNGPRARPSGD